MWLPAARNVAIILALAAAVAFLPGGGTASRVLVTFFSIVFLASIALLGYRLYRENRVAVYGLGDRNRGLLYGSLGLIVLAMSGTPKLWDTGIGVLVWFAMVGAAAYAMLSVFRSWREYG